MSALRLYIAARPWHNIVRRQLLLASGLAGAAACRDQILLEMRGAVKAGNPERSVLNCDYAVQKLLDKQLIEITGKAETVGRPMLYGTTPKFMEYFGINDIGELPVPKDFAGDINIIGESTDLKEPDAQA